MKWLHVLLSYINYSIEHYPFFFHTVKLFQALLCITNNSIKHQSFVNTQLKDQTILFLTILFIISHLFAHRYNVKQFYWTHRKDPIRFYHWAKVDLGAIQGYFPFPQTRNWSLTIRLFHVVSRILVGEWGSYTSSEIQLVYSIGPAKWAWR